MACVLFYTSCKLNLFEMQKSNPKKSIRKPQHQQRPGIEANMIPAPKAEKNEINSSNKLAGKTAAITGGDSGTGKAVAPVV